MPDTQADTKQYEILFLQALRDALPNIKLHSDAQLTKKITQERLADVSLEFFSFILDGVISLPNKNELLALASQSLTCLKKYIHSRELPVTLKTIVDHVSLLDEAVDRCFPGYVKSKLLKYTILSKAV